MISPDGRRYAIRVIRGNVERDGVDLEVLTGTLDSLDSARPQVVAQLFTRALSAGDSPSGPDKDPDVGNRMQWRDSTHIAFLWSDLSGIRQVFEINLLSHVVSQLTHSPTQINMFAIGADAQILYSARIEASRAPSEQRVREGLTLPSTTDALAVLDGIVDGSTQLGRSWDSSWWLQTARTQTRPESRPHLIPIGEDDIDPGAPAWRTLSVSPDKNWVLIGTPTPTRAMPVGWERYTNPVVRSFVNTGRVQIRYSLLDLRTAHSRPLWSAASNPSGVITWSPNSETVSIAPTFLPPDNGSAAGLNGDAAAVIDIATGSYREEKMGSGQQQAPKAVENNARIQLKVRGDLNTPPAIIGIDRVTKQERMLLDPNRELVAQIRLGAVQQIEGSLSGKSKWIGRLILPVAYVRGHRYPVVIQSEYGVPVDDSFSVDGTIGSGCMGTGPSAQPSYPGQLLAARGIAVLQLEVIGEGQGVSEATTRQLAFERAAQYLISIGIADPKKIGLSGLSRNGYWVEYTLAHSGFPFAAAVTVDNWDPSYMQSALVDWRDDDAEANGAPAFGVGLAEWIKNAPGFNAEKIHTPLKMIGQSVGMASYVLSKWEIFSRLRYLHKPVEMYLMPDMNAHPAHSPQNPRQIIAIQQSVLEWYDRWLNDRDTSLSVSLTLRDRPIDDVLIAKLDAYLSGESERSGFSGSVLVAADNHVILNRGYGIANREWNSANTRDTRFRIASVTKAFTATAIMRLAAAHRLALTDGICRYLSACPPQWDAVTIEHLLSQSSGIPEYIPQITAGSKEWAATIRSATDSRHIVASVGELPLRFPPGSTSSYSSTNSIIAGMIIETITGQNYAQALKDLVLLPLGIQHTGVDEDTDVVDQRASGYEINGQDQVQKAAFVDISWFGSASNLHSTTDDLYRWFAAISKPGFLPASLQVAMRTPLSLTNKDLPGEGPFFERYGRGLQLTPSTANSGVTRIGHVGRIPGFSAEVQSYTPGNITVIVLSNTTGTGVDTSTISDRLAEMTLHCCREPIAKSE